MKKKILIVEDNFLLAEELSALVEQELNATAVMTDTAAAAIELLPNAVNLAFLDIEVLDGNTYPVARKLAENQIPFIFISGNDQQTIPHEFRHLPFLAKPFLHGKLVRLANSLMAPGN